MHAFIFIKEATAHVSMYVYMYVYMHACIYIHQRSHRTCEYVCIYVRVYACVHFEHAAITDREAAARVHPNLMDNHIFSCMHAHTNIQVRTIHGFLCTNARALKSIEDACRQDTSSLAKLASLQQLEELAQVDMEHLCMLVYTHTHTHIYIYMYFIYGQAFSTHLLLV